MPTGLLPQDGIIVLSRYRHLDIDPRSIARDVAHGALVRLRRGTYVDGSEWDAAGDRVRHVLRVKAVVAVARRPFLVSGISAAALWGMPVARPFPREVSVLDRWRGGGRAEPGVRRSAAGFETAMPASVGGIPVTSISRTALQIAREEAFQDAVGSVDWSIWRRNPVGVSKVALLHELERSGIRSGHRRVAAAFDFATHLSDSFGESEARAVIHQLGFEPPELQVEFRDAEGLIVPDYLWRDVRKYGEFDGKGKYTRDEFTRGDPGEVVWREKKRQDRLGRLGVSGIRILTEHVRNPLRLEALLAEAGIPRRAT